MPKRKRKKGRPQGAPAAHGSGPPTSPPEGTGRPTLAIVLVAVVVLAAFAWYLSYPSTATTPETRPGADHSPQGSDRKRSPGAVALEPGSHTRSADSRPPAASAGPLDAVSTPRAEARLAAQRRALNPLADGWQTEALGDAAGAQLKQVGKLLAAPEKIKADALNQLATAEFLGRPLRPAALDVTVRDQALTVRRAATKATTAEVSYLGPEGLGRALAKLVEPLAGATDVHTKFKVIRVEPVDDRFKTTAYFQLSGHTTSGRWQQSATWDCTWTKPGPQTPPRLLAAAARDYEEVVTTTENPLFADCTLAILGGNASAHEQLAYGLNHWLERIERVHEMQVFERTGMALGDVNGDGLDDVYLCQPGGLPNRLYLHNPDGTATDASQQAGIDLLDATSAALFVDLDNDGDQDLVVATSVGLLLWENTAEGHFKWRTRLTLADEDVQSLTAVDYDNDGDLDLYICVDFSVNKPEADSKRSRFIYYDANDGGANALFRNDIGDAASDWQFADVTAETGLDAHNQRHSLAAAWEDYDNDGDFDLYVANDYGQNCLYRNDDGKFVDVAVEAGVVDFGSGMSVSWGDFNRDGLMDLHVANMFSSAGNRITTQHKFKTGEEEDTRALYKRFAKGNTLFENLGGGKFRDVGAQAGVEMGRWAWSSLFVDLNNDSLEDVFVANGYITTEDTGDL